MSRRIGLVREAIVFLGIPALVMGLLLWLMPALSILPFVLLLFTAWFFRDPIRAIPGLENDICAPADGRIMEIEEVREERFLKGAAIRVVIFLSLIDVHQNRAPTNGRVIFLAHEKGRFRPAFNKSAGCENERNYIGIENIRGKVLVVQVAGTLARRIVCGVREGEVLKAGQRVGMIRFGSRTELFLPKGRTEALVRPGQHVRAGETLVGRWIR